MATVNGYFTADGSGSKPPKAVGEMEFRNLLFKAYLQLKVKIAFSQHFQVCFQILILQVYLLHS